MKSKIEGAENIAKKKFNRQGPGREGERNYADLNKTLPIYAGKEENGN